MSWEAQGIKGDREPAAVKVKYRSLLLVHASCLALLATEYADSGTVKDGASFLATLHWSPLKFGCMQFPDFPAEGDTTSSPRPPKGS